MAEVQQWQGKTGGGRFGQWFLFTTLKVVKVTFFYPILLPILPFIVAFAKKARKSSWRYFRSIWQYTPWKAICCTFKNFHIFAKVVLDKFALAAGHNRQFSVEVIDNKVFANLLQQEKGFIIAGAHIGNFEMLGQCLKQDVKPINGIIFGGESQQLSQKRTETFRRNNVNLIPVMPDMSHLFALKTALDNGEIVTILCDRIFGSSKKMSTPLLGHPADFPMGTFKMAVQLEVPMIAAFVMKEKGRNYTTYLFPLHPCPESEASTARKTEYLIQQYAQSIETVLKKYPEQWFNFFDFWNFDSKK